MRLFRLIMLAVGFCVLVGYVVFSMFGASIHNTHMARLGMNAETCPYAPSQQALCASDSTFVRSAFDFFGSNSFGFAGALLFVWLLLHHALFLQKGMLYLKKHKKRQVFSLYQFLFSAGLLNSKAY